MCWRLWLKISTESESEALLEISSCDGLPLFKAFKTCCMLLHSLSIEWSGIAGPEIPGCFASYKNRKKINKSKNIYIGSLMGPLCRMGTQVALRWGGRILSKKIKRSRRYPFNDPGPPNSMRHRCGAHCHLDLCHRDLERGGCDSGGRWSMLFRLHLETSEIEGCTRGGKDFSGCHT